MRRGDKTLLEIVLDGLAGAPTRVAITAATGLQRRQPVAGREDVAALGMDRPAVDLDLAKAAGPAAEYALRWKFAARAEAGNGDIAAAVVHELDALSQAAAKFAGSAAVGQQWVVSQGH